VAKLLLLIISAFSVFISLTTVTYAWWDSSKEVTQASILIGVWQTETNIWQPNEIYSEGDIVLWNGQLWVRNSRGSGSNIEPNTAPPGRNFWIPLD
jgi:hypothetical protein